ncbi:endonuclease/exonuclease/phosphatase family protein [bacterium]|nr:endonuclease/exonuclease/phosphatase family protein [bacterium]
MKSPYFSLYISLFLLACDSRPDSISGGLNNPKTMGGSRSTITVMSYNVLHGGGIDPQYDDISAEIGFPGNRISKVLQVIRAVDPDILGIQEALSWETGSPPFASAFADSLGGFNYFLALSKGIHHVAIYTKFKILKASNFRKQFSRAALMASLETSDGDTLSVLVAHIHPVGPDKIDESSHLVRMAKNLSTDKAILIGDLNQLPENGPVGDALSSGGWHLAAKDVPIGIDHIWISPAWPRQNHQMDALKDFSISTELLDVASDHWLVVAKVRINHEDVK